MLKRGVDLAETNRVPKAVIDFISQHHGTSLIEFFYDKALKEATEDETVEEAFVPVTPDLKPQTKEAGILMLADAIEAVSRTLQEPSHAKIQGLVQKMINKDFRQRAARRESSNAARSSHHRKELR
jgi:membrane-associated HD superfamily phosphohydrolase